MLTDIVANLSLGFGTAVQPGNLLYCLVGATLGTVIGVLPGVGPTATIAMLLPLTFALDPTGALIMLAGIYYGAQYGGSTTAILINLPGEASSVVTAVDGHQMARKGRGGAALAIAALGSFFAGTVATLLVAVFVTPLSRAALAFGPAEYFSLIVLGLVASVALARGPVVKALAMVVLGLLLGLVGADPQSGATRFTMGLFSLYDGINIVALAVGIFGLGEIFRNLEHGGTGKARVSPIGSLMPTRSELRASVGPVLRGTGLGSLLGILPGSGATLSSFASYALEKQISRDKSRFGSGAVEGVAGPESANNAGAQTSFVPMLTLGLPANAVMAMMIGALVIHGIVPGPSVAEREPALFWGLIASMWLGNLMLLVLNLPLIGLWVRLFSVPYLVLFPTIIAFSYVGVFSVNGNAADILIVAAAALVGYVLIRGGCEPAPLLIGFVLGPMLEQNLRRAMLISKGDPSTFVTRPLSLALLIVAALFLLAMILPRVSALRKAAFVESDD